LRQCNPETIERAAKLRQEQQKLHKAILAEMEHGPKTVPELAQALERETREVFWHLMALKKYNRISEDKKQGEYVGYCKKN
jgi:predicted transcriptional regulator